MAELRRRIQVKRAPERDEGARVAYQWRVTINRANQRPEVTQGVLFATRDGIALESGHGSRRRAGWEQGDVVAVLLNERHRAGAFPERIDVHEAPRPDPAAQRPPPLSHRRGESGLGLGSLAERARRQDRR